MSNTDVDPFGRRSGGADSSGTGFILSNLETAGYGSGGRQTRKRKARDLLHVRPDHFDPQLDDVINNPNGSGTGGVLWGTGGTSLDDTHALNRDIDEYLRNNTLEEASDRFNATPAFKKAKKSIHLSNRGQLKNIIGAVPSALFNTNIAVGSTDNTRGPRAGRQINTDVRSGTTSTLMRNYDSTGNTQAWMNIKQMAERNAMLEADINTALDRNITERHDAYGHDGDDRDDYGDILKPIFATALINKFQQARGAPGDPAGYPGPPPAYDEFGPIRRGKGLNPALYDYYNYNPDYSNLGFTDSGALTSELAAQYLGYVIRPHSVDKWIKLNGHLLATLPTPPAVNMDDAAAAGAMVVSESQGFINTVLTEIAKSAIINDIVGILTSKETFLAPLLALSAAGAGGGRGDGLA